MICRNCGHQIRKVNGVYKHAYSESLNRWRESIVCFVGDCTCERACPIGGV